MPKTLISTHIVPDDYSGAICEVDITSGIDSTYPVYEFHFVNMHPSVAGAKLQFQVDTGTLTAYDQPMTTTNFNAQQTEAGTEEGLAYYTGGDQAGTDKVFQQISSNIWDNNDDSGAGVLTLYEPSSATYVKHFTSQSMASGNTWCVNNFVAGYVNTATALTRIRFAMNSGNIDAGVIKMYGVT
jgi:hypothetical protein